MSNWTDHSSILGRALGKVQEGTDVLNLVGGQKWSNLVNQKLPDLVNSVGSHVIQPFDYVDKTINPVRKIPIVNRIGDIVAAKPGDAGALAAGAFFGGSALLGGGGLGGGGAGAAAGDGLGAGSLGTASGFGGVGTDGAVTGIGAGDGFASVVPATSSGFGGVGTDAGVSGPSASSGSGAYQKLLGNALSQFGQQKQQQGSGAMRAVNIQPGNVPWNFMGGQ